jgi:hypothetical protein
VHWSDQLGLVCCAPCYVQRTPYSAQAAAWKPAPAERTRRTQTRYQKLHGRVWQALEARGEVFPRCDGSGVLVGWCPACGAGVVSVQLLDNPPRVRLDACSAGCPPKRIAEALK